MTAAEIKSLLNDARCIQSCVPDGMKMAALIALLADYSGAAINDESIKSLMADAACINSCIPSGLQLPALISLLFDGVSETTPETPCVNLIPDGSHYQGVSFSLAFLNSPSNILQANTTYQITFGANDTLLGNSAGTPTSLNGPGTFIFTTTDDIDIMKVGLQTGTPNSPVTATICEV